MRYISGSRKTKLVVESICNPSLFASNFLNLDLWSTQIAVLHALQTSRRVSVKACHASGKTLVAAAASLWFLMAHDEAIVLTTAPTWMQVENVLWREIRKLAAQSAIAFPEPNVTSMHLGHQRYAIGLSPDQGVRLQGYHCRNILVIVDEATGVAPGIWEAVEGIRAGGNVKLLCLGNPTLSSGKFYDFFHAERAGWSLYTISAFDTPNFAGVKLEYDYNGDEVRLGEPSGRDLLELTEEELDCNPRPYLVTRRWVREKYEEWGPGHHLWQTRVLGQFATQPDDALFPLAWLEYAKTCPMPPGEPLEAGIDVAGPGESETTLFVRRGNVIVFQGFWTKADPLGDVVAALRPFQQEEIKVKVDSVGIGYHFVERLRDAGFNVEGVNVGETAGKPGKYVNKKAEYYWALRERARKGHLAGLTDETTIGQLAALRYSHNAQGLLAIERKEDARKRGVKSPDRAEGLMLAFAESGEFGIIGFLREEAEGVGGGPPMSQDPWQVVHEFLGGYSDPWRSPWSR